MIPENWLQFYDVPNFSGRLVILPKWYLRQQQLHWIGSDDPEDQFHLPRGPFWFRWGPWILVGWQWVSFKLGLRFWKNYLLQDPLQFKKTAGNEQRSVRNSGLGPAISSSINAKKKNIFVLWSLQDWLHWPCLNRANQAWFSSCMTISSLQFVWRQIWKNLKVSITAAVCFQF